MLSICIPVYNLEVTELVNDLLEQVSINQHAIEILLIDDGSDAAIVKANAHLAGLVRSVQLQENIGRSRIRNLFLSYATHEYLLFLDCDAKVINRKFLQYYTDYLSAFAPDVLCGGSICSEAVPPVNQRLRWTYCRQIESKTSAERAEKQIFITKNFTIKKQVLAAVPFNERISKYGHEDTLLGIDLRKHQYNIEHIDNPVLNNDMDTNAQFLQKTKESMSNLAELYLDRQSNYDLSSVRIIAFYEKLKRLRVAAIAGTCLKWLQPVFAYTLEHHSSAVWLLHLYKLSHFLNEIKQKSKI